MNRRRPSELLIVSTLVGVYMLALLLFWLTLPTRYFAVADEGPWTPAILSDTSLYLPDFSFAGYRWSEEELPRPSTTHTIWPYGANPDDGFDDTGAFRAALDAMRQDTGWVVLSLPTGTFEIEGTLFLERSRMILRGAVAPDGSPGTMLRIRRPLSDLGEAKVDSLLSDIKSYQEENYLRNMGRPYSPTTWAGGFLWIRRPGPADPIPALPPGEQPSDTVWAARAGKRGHHELLLSNGPRPHAGQRVEIRWANREGRRGEFLDHVFGRHDLPIGERLVEDPDRPLILQPVTIDSISAHPDGWAVVLHEPLLHDVRAAWQAEVHDLNRVSQIGLENLILQFPEHEPAPHHLDEGFNGIYLTDVRDSWLSNVRIENADNAVLTNRADHITIQGLHTTGSAAHHSVYISNSSGILVQNFTLTAPALHHPSLNTGSSLSVFSGGTIRHAMLDQHAGMNEQNLFDDLRIQTREPWLSGGGAGYWDPTSGRFTTFWNVVAERGPILIGLIDDAPEVRMIGVRNARSRIEMRYGPAAYVEGLHRKDISIPSLFDWQLDQRLGR